MTNERVEIVFDTDELTLGDLEFLQDEHGDDVLDQLMAFGEPGEDGKTRMPVKLLINFAWRILLHHNPDATIEDARNVRFVDLGEAVEVEQVDPPKPPDDAS